MLISANPTQRLLAVDGSRAWMIGERTANTSKPIQAMNCLQYGKRTVPATYFLATKVKKCAIISIDINRESVIKYKEVGRHERNEQGFAFKKDQHQ